MCSVGREYKSCTSTLRLPRIWEISTPLNNINIIQAYSLAQYRKHSVGQMSNIGYEGVLHTIRKEHPRRRPGLHPRICLGLADLRLNVEAGYSIFVCVPGRMFEPIVVDMSSALALVRYVNTTPRSGSHTDFLSRCVWLFLCG